MEKICGNCKFFILHYRKEPNGYYQVCCGHCFRLRVKTRNPERGICEYFEEKGGAEYKAEL